ncbi:MAG: T9SS type A sorting domain-containing protein, partial [Bacteroidota bacterium]
PNPADEVVFLDLPTWSEGGRVMLLDLTGRVVYGAQVTRESMRLRVDAGALTSGIYLVKVVNGGKAFTGKLTVRR